MKKRYTTPAIYHVARDLRETKNAIMDVLWRHPRSIKGIKSSIASDFIDEAIEMLTADYFIRLDGIFFKTIERQDARYFYKGELLTARQLSNHADNRHGLVTNALKYRLQQGWPEEELMMSRTDNRRWSD